MKGKRPTRRQKLAINWAGLNPRHWLVIKSLPDELEIKHRETGMIKTIPQWEGGWSGKKI